MNKKTKLIKNIGLMALGQFSSKALSFLLVPLYTSCLSTEEYGIFEVITTMVLLLMPLLTLTIAEGVMRFCLDKQNDGGDVLSVGLSLAGYSILFLLILYPAAVFIPQISIYYGWFLAYYIVNVLHLILTQYLKGINKIALFSFCGVLSSLLTIGLNILFLLVMKLTITGYMLAYIIAHAAVIILIVLMEKIWTLKMFRPKETKLLKKQMLAYTIPMVPNSISWWVSNASDRYIMRFFWDMSLVGIYSVGYKIPSIMSVAATIFMSAWNISSVENFGSDESKRFFSQMWEKIYSLSFIMATGMIAFAKPIGLFLYKKDFFIAWRVSVVLIFAFLLYAFACFFASIYTAAKQTKTLFYSTLFAAGINILLNFLLIPGFDMLGAAVATVLSYLVCWLYRMFDSRKIFQFDIRYISLGISCLIISLQVVVVYIDLPFSQWVGYGLLLTVMILNWKKASSGLLQLVSKKKFN